MWLHLLAALLPPLLCKIQHLADMLPAVLIMCSTARFEHTQTVLVNVADLICGQSIHHHVISSSGSNR